MREVPSDFRSVMVVLGMGNPASRAFVAGTAAAGVAYLSGYPKQAFRDDGSMKPLKFISPDPDATNTHFLLIPAVAAAAVFLFT